MPDSGAGTNVFAKRVAVVVVHGVGETKPGETIDYVVDSLCKSHKAQAGDPAPAANLHSEVHWLDEPGQPATTGTREGFDKDGKPVNQFPVFVRGAELPGGAKASFIELHWADISRSGGGMLAMIIGFARFIFEIPHMVDGFLLKPPGRFSTALRHLLLFVTCYVRGPLAGFCTVMLAGGAIFTSYGVIPEREDVQTLFEKVIGLAAASPAAATWLAAPAVGVLAEIFDLRFSVLFVVALALAIMLSIGVGVRWNKRPIVLAVAAFAGLVALFYAVDAAVWHPWRYQTYACVSYFDYLSVALFGVGCAGAYIFMTRRTRDIGFADLGLFTALWAAFLVLDLSQVGSFRLTDSEIPSGCAAHSSEIHFKAFRHYYELLRVIWAIWAVPMGVAIILAVGLYGRNFWRWDQGWRGIFAALALAVLQACVWLSALPAVGVLHMDDVLCRQSRYSDKPSEPVSCQTKLRDNAVAFRLLKHLERIDTQTPGALTEAQRTELRKAIAARDLTLDQGMLSAMNELSLSLLWHTVIIGTAVILALGAAAWRHVRARYPKRPPENVKLPRLIINRVNLGFLALLGIVNVALCLLWIKEPFINRFGTLGGLLTKDSTTMVELPAEVVQVIILAGSAIVMLSQLPLISKAFGGVQHIMQDLIDHQYRLNVGFSGMLNPADKSQPVRRQRIDKRMDAVISRFVAEKGYDGVVFLAHSQGTVIVFDYLRSSELALRQRPFVLTAGAPVSALYEYYFNEYGNVSRMMTEMKLQPLRWTNFYRTDDPIAGPISGPISWSLPEPARAKAPAFANVAMGPGGHLAYWQEKVVCDEVMRMLDQASVGVH